MRILQKVLVNDSNLLIKTTPANGMVLMTVLWIVLVISFIAFALAAAVRVEIASAASSFDSERAIFMAKGAAETVLQKIKNPKIFPPSPMQEQQNEYVFEFDSGEVRVKSEFDNGRIDLNGADEKVLASMFDSMGIDASTRDALVDSILDWRDLDDVPRQNGAEIDDYGGGFVATKRLPSNGPFTSIQELMLVKHMTPDVYFGRISFDPSSNEHHKILGLRDIATIGL
jgi:general secretion pathway protein K